MKLNKVEKFMMNNAIRATLARWFYKGVVLRRLGRRLDGMRVLEIGCGSGVITQVILDLGAAEGTCF